MTDFIKFDPGNLCMVSEVLTWEELVCSPTERGRHTGSSDAVHTIDASGNSFAARLSRVFVIGRGHKPRIALLCGNGICLSVLEERQETGGQMEQ